MTSERDEAPAATRVRPDPALFAALGRAIKVARTQQDVSRRELASRANVSYAYLSDIETGRGRPSSRSLFQIAQALGRSPSELLGEAEMYGELEMLEVDRAQSFASTAAAPSDVAHLSSVHRASSTAPGPPPPEVIEQHRLKTREQLQRLARSRLAITSSAERDELHATVDGLSDEDVILALALLRRLRRV